MRQESEPVGFWRTQKESGIFSFLFGGPSLPWPEPCEWNPDEKSQVLKHLESAPILRAWYGFSTCRLCGKPNGSSERGDGQYHWPDGLAHYVRDHSVLLPRKFIDHICK